MKKIGIILVFVFLQSCWAPRCPMESCRSKYEHQHGDQVSGIFSPRKFEVPKLHFIWDKNKGTANPDTKFQPDGMTRKQKKARKKFPWERW